MEILGYLAAIFIGITLGLIGGGGSILTVPILVYLFDINPENATSYSLFIVGTTALLGCYRHYMLGNLKIKPALYFGIASVFSLLFVRKIVLPKIPQLLGNINGFEITKDLLIMLVFAVLMMAAAIAMIRSTKEPEKSTIHFWRLAFIGFVVGLVTGFLGAGGGFLIVPALLFFAGLPMKQAVGTSLMIIFINSLIGFGGDLIGGVPLNYTLLFTLTIIAIVGMLIGTQLSKKMDGARLRPLFGWFVLIMGIYIILKEILVP